jgi:hypothetical protein
MMVTFLPGKFLECARAVRGTSMPRAYLRVGGLSFLPANMYSIFSALRPHDLFFFTDHPHTTNIQANSRHPKDPQWRRSNSNLHYSHLTRHSFPSSATMQQATSATALPISSSASSSHFVSISVRNTTFKIKKRGVQPLANIERRHCV